MALKAAAETAGKSPQDTAEREDERFEDDGDRDDQRHPPCPSQTRRAPSQARPTGAPAATAPVAIARAGTAYRGQGGRNGNDAEHHVERA